MDDDFGDRMPTEPEPVEESYGVARQRIVIGRYILVAVTGVAIACLVAASMIWNTHKVGASVVAVLACVGLAGALRALHLMRSVLRDHPPAASAVASAAPWPDDIRVERAAVAGIVAVLGVAFALTSGWYFATGGA